VFAVMVLIVAVVALLAGGIVTGMSGALARTFAQEGWGDKGPVMVGRLSGGLFHMGIVMGATGLMILLGSLRIFRAKLRVVLQVLVGVLLTGDLVLVGKRYVEVYDERPLYRSNRVIEILQAETEPFRLKLLDRGGLYDYWLSTIFPHYGIQTMDRPATSRLPGDELAFSNTVGKNLLRYWQLTNCRYLLASRERATRILETPGLDKLFETALAFDVGRDAGGLVVAPASPTVAARYHLLRFKAALPRAMILSRWTWTDSREEALQKLVEPSFDAIGSVLLSKRGGSEKYPEPTSSSAPFPVRIVSYQAKHIEMVVAPADHRRVLLFNDKYDSRWKAWADGKPTSVYPANYIMRGVLVPAGAQRVTLSYRPSLRWPLLSLGSLFMIGAWGALVVAKRAFAVRQREQPQEGAGSAREGEEN